MCSFGASCNYPGSKVHPSPLCTLYSITFTQRTVYWEHLIHISVGLVMNLQGVIPLPMMTGEYKGLWMQLTSAVLNCDSYEIYNIYLLLLLRELID